MSNSNHTRASPKDLLEARRVLQKEQQVLPPEVLTELPDKTDLTLQALHSMCKFVRAKDPQVVKRGVFKFNLTKERERIRIAKKLVRRIKPGPCEDPTYLALLVFQAASLELGWSHLPREEHPGQQLSELLLGTVHRAEVNASSYSRSVPGYTIVTMNSGLVDFIYQAAKAVVVARKPLRSEDHHFAVQTQSDLKQIRAGLQQNPAPIDRVWRTLEAYFFHGYPRAFAFETVENVQIPPLEILVSMAERWLIAHELSHGLAVGIPWTPGQDLAAVHRDWPKNPLWAEEFFSDSIATVLTVLSAADLDGLPPEASLSGGTFALACIDILRKALSILRTGVVSEDMGTLDHPPAETRAEQNIVTLRRYFDVKYFEGGAFDLSFVLRKKAPQNHSFTPERSKEIYVDANVLFEIWNSVKGILLNQFQARRPLHPMWG